MTVAQITEVPPVAILPNFIVQRKVLRPFRYQTGGTILVRYFGTLKVTVKDDIECMASTELE